MRAAQQATKAVKNFWCQGKVSLYDEKTRCGHIQGFDRHEYDFSMDEWANKNEMPRAGMIVNFEIKGDEQTREAVSIKIR